MYCGVVWIIESDLWYINLWNIETAQTRKQFFHVFIFSSGSVRVSGKFSCSGLLCATKPVGSKMLLTVTPW